MRKIIVDNSVITPETVQKLYNVARDQMLQKNKHLLFCAVSGSHIWGLSRPDSDFDIRGIYSDSPQDFLGFKSSTDTVEFKVAPDIDGQFYEVEKFLRLLCNGNGNMVIQVLSPITIYTQTEFDFTNLASKAITKKLKWYFKGYAQSQRKRALAERGSKALLYTYREIFSGLYVMKYGKIEFSFQKLLDTAIENGWYPKEGGLLQGYYPYTVGVSIAVPNEQWQRFWTEWEQMDKLLEEEADKSTLPNEPVGLREECEQLLIQYRRELVNGLS
jgi:hypothetical protein